MEVYHLDALTPFTTKTSHTKTRNVTVLRHSPPLSLDILCDQVPNKVASRLQTSASGPLHGVCFVKIQRS